jgi:hypothetical protein
LNGDENAALQKSAKAVEELIGVIRQKTGAPV